MSSHPTPLSFSTMIVECSSVIVELSSGGGRARHPGRRRFKWHPSAAIYSSFNTRTGAAGIVRSSAGVDPRLHIPQEGYKPLDYRFHASQAQGAFGSEVSAARRSQTAGASKRTSSKVSALPASVIKGNGLLGETDFPDLLLACKEIRCEVAAYIEFGANLNASRAIHRRVLEVV
jgi:hypothetical protein